MTKNIAVILAGGSGARLGAGVPKQFLKVAGKRVIEHTLDVFERCTCFSNLTGEVVDVRKSIDK